MLQMRYLIATVELNYKIKLHKKRFYLVSYKWKIRVFKCISTW